MLVKIRAKKEYSKGAAFRISTTPNGIKEGDFVNIDQYPDHVVLTRVCIDACERSVRADVNGVLRVYRSKITGDLPTGEFEVCEESSDQDTIVFYF